MRVASLRRAAWQRHVNAVGAPGPMRAWLMAEGSLTARLVAHSAAFRVQRLRQRSGLCLADEAAAIGMRRPGRVWEREVLLRCDGVPVVFGHTVVPAACSAADWPLFSALGERSLGSTLFYDPLVWRGELEFARLRPSHPLVRRALAAVGGEEQAVYYARRCLYRRRNGTLLVTEVFMPQVTALAPNKHNKQKAS